MPGDSNRGSPQPEAEENDSPPSSNSPTDAIRESWDANADAWTEAVRSGHIPSRRQGTDAAVITACTRVLASSHDLRVLDVGCGEGWLARALAPYASSVLGIDASRSLVDHARGAAAGMASVSFEVATYEDLRASSGCVAGPFELIVANYALLDDTAEATLLALASRLSPTGRIVVQTLHPWAALGDRVYEDGWRVETFDAFQRPFPSPMPWYFRTLGAWIEAVRAAGLQLERFEEPLGPDGKRALSLLLTLSRRDDAPSGGSRTGMPLRD